MPGQAAGRKIRGSDVLLYPQKSLEHSKAASFPPSALIAQKTRNCRRNKAWESSAPQERTYGMGGSICLGGSNEERKNNANNKTKMICYPFLERADVRSRALSAALPRLLQKAGSLTSVQSNPPASLLALRNLPCREHKRGGEWQSWNSPSPAPLAGQTSVHKLLKGHSSTAEVTGGL